MIYTGFGMKLLQSAFFKSVPFIKNAGDEGTGLGWVWFWFGVLVLFVWMTQTRLELKIPLFLLPWF